MITALTSEDYQLNLQYEKSESRDSVNFRNRKVFDKSAKSSKLENVCLINAKSGQKLSLKCDMASSSSSLVSRLPQKDPSAGWVCFYCKDKGHGISRCPKLKDIDCRKCGNKGHIAKHC